MAAAAPMAVDATGRARGAARVDRGVIDDALEDEEHRRRLETLATNVARCALEAIAGTRDLDQLARWVTPGVYRALLTRVQHAQRARRARRRAVTRAHVRVRTVTAQHEAAATEATVVVELGPRVRAVCVRLEPDESRWRASSVSVL